MPNKGRTKPKASKPTRTKRMYLSQSDVPGCSLEQALRVATAIVDNYASEPVTPLHLADALKMSPTSGPFRQLCGASIAYGLTKGGYNAKLIAITSLAKQIIKPREEGKDLAAKKQAVLKPTVMGAFLNKYAGHALPRVDIAKNVLEEMRVPCSKTDSVYHLILECAQAVGLIRDINGKQYVDLSGVDQTPGAERPDNQESMWAGALDEKATGSTKEEAGSLPSRSIALAPGNDRRVFITHGKDKEFIEPLKKLLTYGELIPVVSVEQHSVSKPVPDKVMDDMRSCCAAIIHVADERRLIDKEAKEHVIINPNVLIEIGAAIALYGRRFIMLVKEGVKLPSNLQGLYEVRYSGNALDGAATIALLEAINDIKNYPIPAREKEQAAD